MTTSDSNRVLRGGSWDSDAIYCRSAILGIFDPSVVFQVLGFRPILRRKKR